MVISELRPTIKDVSLDKKHLWADKRKLKTTHWFW
jgi:hypothetical protein